MINIETENVPQRGFEFAMKKTEDQFDGDVKMEKAYPDAKYPVYSTLGSAGADFFCAQEVTIDPVPVKIFNEEGLMGAKPTLVHTGIKAFMQPDEALMLYNRSSNPKKLGLVLANGVGVVDSDYYGNPDNDGEIMFAFYNVSGKPVTLNVGDKIGQGVFQKFLRAEVGSQTLDVTRQSGFGSTGRK